MPGGRPTDYDPEYCNRVIELGKTGASRVEIACELEVVTETLKNWERAHPEFLVAMTRALQLSQVWWEREGRSNLKAAVFQASMWSRSMAARFPHDWRETTRQEQSGINGAPIETKNEITWSVVDPKPRDPA